jgi:hypothetical protein
MGLIYRPNIQIYTYFQNVAPNITPANLPEFIIGPNYQVVYNQLATPTGSYTSAFGLTTAYIGQGINTVTVPSSVTGSYVSNSIITPFPWTVFSGVGATLSSTTYSISFSSTQQLSIVPANAAENVPGDNIVLSYPSALTGSYTIMSYTYSSGLNVITIPSGSLPANVNAVLTDVNYSIVAQSVTATSSTITFPRRYTMIDPSSSGTLSGTITYSGASTVITSTVPLSTSTLGHVALISGSVSNAIYAVYPVTAATTSTLTINYTAAPPTSGEGIVYKHISLVGSISGTVYETYKALNQFQSPVTIGSITDINTYLYGVSTNPTDNPLALAAEFALANGITPVTVFGVPSDNLAGYNAVSSQIYINNIYTTVPLTQDLTTQQSLVNYVASLNVAGEAQVERRIIVTPAYVSYTPVVSAVSGTITDNSGVTTFVYPGTLSVTPQIGNYVQIVTGSYAGEYLISGVTISGGYTTVTSTTHMAINKVPDLTNITAVMTSNQQANWLASYGQLFNSTQVNSLVWDEFESVLGGVTYMLPMYYAAAGLGAMIASLPPQQQFNGMSIAGVNAIVHSNVDLFNLGQEDIIAGGGNIMLISKYNGGPVIIRNQINTSVGTIQTQSLNITKDIDFVKRMIRANVSNFLVGTNATPAVLPYISASVDGIINYCKKQIVPNAGPILEFGSVNSIDLVNDGVTIDITLKAPYPLDNMTFNLYVM